MMFVLSLAFNLDWENLSYHSVVVGDGACLDITAHGFGSISMHTLMYEFSILMPFLPIVTSVSMFSL